MKLRQELTDKVVECFEKRITHWTGRLTNEEREEIERRGIQIYVMSIYMDGTADYGFRYSLFL